MMRVEINENLEVKITAESALEVIALRAWSDDYFKRKPKQASLVVQLFVEKKETDTQDNES